MRFHHTSIRARNRSSRFNRYSSVHNRLHGHQSSSRWPQLDYCRETNLYFNRRTSIEPIGLGPSELDSEQVDPAGGTLADHQAVDSELIRNLLEEEEDNNENEIISGEDQDGNIEDRLHDLNLGEIPMQKSLESNDLQIDLETVRTRLMAEVHKHPFWSNKAAKKMELTKVEERNIYIYELMSFCERREIEWRHEPYRGRLVSMIPHRILEKPTPTPDLRREGRPTGVVGEDKSPFAWVMNKDEELIQTPHISLAMASTYEPIGAIKQEQPSHESIWKIEPTNQVRQKLFTTSVHSTEIPNTSFVKRCHLCQGRGKIKCHSCHGVGYEVCIGCSGKGTTKNLSSHMTSNSLSDYSSRSYSTYKSGRDSSSANQDCDSSTDGGRGHRDSPTAGVGSMGSNSGWHTESCHFCHGAGQKRCWICAGKSYNYCSGCVGAGQLRCYLNLTITWINHRDEKIINNDDDIISLDRLYTCSGILLVDQIADRLKPIASEARSAENSTGLYEPDIHNQIWRASRSLLIKHMQKYKSEKLIKQRHRMTQIRSFIVKYNWKRESGHFVVYGEEEKIYIAKYPFKSICNIT